MSKKIMLLIVILLLFVVESPVMAEIKGEELTVSPFLGAYIYDGSQLLEPSFNAGMRLGYNLSRNWGMEGQLAYATLKNDGTHGSQLNFSGDLLYHFYPEKKVVPYLLVGGGWSKTDYVVGKSSNGIFEYGAGLKYFISNDVAFRWDFRQVYSLNPNSGTSTEYWQNSSLNVGMSFQYGGVKRVSPALKEAAPNPAPEGPASWLAENTIAPERKILVTEMRVDKNEFEIIATEPIRDYKLFTLSQPSRLVVDIPNGESGFELKKVIINRLGIAAVRFDSFPDYLRIYFDAAQGRLIPYRVEETANGLKIIVTGF